MVGDYALYRYFDITHRLLYIGISGDLAVRDTSHIARSRWMQLTASSNIERYATLKEVQEAERRAIETEHPLFNRQYNDTPEARMMAWASIAEPSVNRTVRADPLTSMATTSRAVTISAPNLAAWRRARSVNCAPETPSGKPR